jgi:hypothetical protein
MKIFQGRLIIPIFILLSGVFLQSCKNDSPKAAAEKFLNNLNHMNYDAAKTVATEETINMLDMLAQFSSMMPDSVKEEARKVTVFIKEEKILTDSTAYVIYTTSENHTEQRLNLVKRSVDGGKEKKWLAQWSKMDQLPEENGTTDVQNGMHDYSDGNHTGQNNMDTVSAN